MRPETQQGALENGCHSMQSAWVQPSASARATVAACIEDQNSAGKHAVIGVGCDRRWVFPIFILLRLKKGGVAKAKGEREKKNKCTTECKSRRRRDEKAPWALNYGSGEKGGVGACLFLFWMVFIGKPRSETKRGGGSRIILRSKPD